MEPLENVLLCSLRNWSSSVTDRQHHFGVISPCRNSDAAARSIVLARVLQKILHNERGVALFAGNKYFGWKLLLDLDLRRVGQRVEVIDPFIDELAEIHRFGINLEMAGVQARQQQQIVDNSSQSVSLMKKPGKLVVDFRFETLTVQQIVKSCAQNRDRTFQLMRGIGGITRLSL